MVDFPKSGPILPTLADKVAFLSNPATHGGQPVTCRETHMSYIFLAGDRVYKLKKPVWFPYLDFRTIDRRESMCRTELRLNRRLAPDVYIDVVPLQWSEGCLSIGGQGRPVEWVVVMHRLNEADTLEQAILSGSVTARQVAAIASALIPFYRHAAPILISPEVHVADWHASLDYNRRILFDQRFHLPSGIISAIDKVQRRFLARCPDLLRERIRARWVRDTHGDLRPEHIWLDGRVRVIDALEFSPRLRANDPYDEIAFLGVECERLGARWIGEMIRLRMMRAFGNGVPDHLFLFYRCHRATLRARLAIAHLLERTPRTPEKWPRQCRSYLSIAARDARKLDRMLNRPENRLVRDWHRA